jgi:hypothetical protein
MDDLKNQITKAVASLNIEGSRTLRTEEITSSDSFLTNSPLTSVHTDAGSTVTAQNNLQLADISRVKDQHDLIEMDWNYKMVTSKPFYIGNGIWNSTQGALTNLYTLSFPVDYFLGNSVLTSVGDTFLSIRGDLHLIVSMQGTPLASGGVIIHSESFWNTQASAEFYDSFFRQHVILDISDNSSTADYVLPFRWNRNGTDPFSTIASVYVDVLVPLSGMNSVNFTVTAFLENQEFKFIRPIESPPGLAKRKAIREGRMTQGLLNITNINNTLSQVENATLPSHLTGDSLDAKVSMMDDIPITANGSAMTVKFPTLNNADNPHPIDRASLISGSSQVSDRSMFNTNIDEMSLDHILKEREHYYDSIVINSSVISGQQIFNMPVVPCPTVAVATSSTQASPMEYYSQFFKFWRGGLKIRIRFFMNRFQSMKFYLGLFYKAITPTTFTDWSSSHGVVVDIGGDKREVEIEIPYNSETPWLNVPHQFLDVVAPYYNDTTIFDYILGQFTMYAMTPLISPAGSPTTIAAVVSFRGADDFEFANYTNTGAITQADSILLSNRSTRTPGYITDNIVSVKQLAKKWTTLINNNTFNTAPDLINQFWFLPVSDAISRYSNLASNGLSTTGNTSLTVLLDKNVLPGMAPFSGIRGSISMRIEMRLSAYLAATPASPSNVNVPIIPYVWFINPDVGWETSAAHGTTLANELANQIENILAPSSGFCTPYRFNPINNTNVGENGLMVFEADIPLQRNYKYAKITNTVNVTADPVNLLPSPADYGFLIFGFATALTSKLENLNVFEDITVSAKLSDDARLGILNYGTMQMLVSVASNENLGYMYPILLP